jgi:hypothetical protein
MVAIPFFGFFRGGGGRIPLLERANARKIE